MHGPWFKDLIDLIACPTLHSKFAGLVVGPEISNGRQSLLLSGSSSAKGAPSLGSGQRHAGYF